jgi:hypothetical protein
VACARRQSQCRRAVAGGCWSRQRRRQPR